MTFGLEISGKEDAANARGHYTIGKEIVDLVLNRLLAQIIPSLTATLRFDGALNVDVTDSRTFHLSDERCARSFAFTWVRRASRSTTHVGSCSASNMTFSQTPRHSQLTVSMPTST